MGFNENEYPKGTRIELIEMPNDPEPIPKGTRGTVTGIDGLGSLLVTWDNGRSLNVLYGIDRITKIGGKRK